MPNSRLGRMLLGATLGVAWFLGVQAVEAQCLKHILIYLDVSGSMAPQKESSPYQQTVEALGLLLREPGLIEDGDLVEASVFGAAPKVVAQSTKKAEIETLLAQLNGYSRSERETDLSSVLRDAGSRLGKPGSYNQRVLIVASDFAHEPRDGMPIEEATRNWRQTYSAIEAILRSQISDGKTTLVLLEAPILRDPKRESFYQGMKTLTLSSLQDTQNEAARIPVGAGGLDASAVAAGIRRSLLRPINVGSPSRSAGQKEKFQLKVENTNCIGTSIERVALRCLTAAGGSGDPVSVLVPGEQQRLEASGQGGGSRLLELDMPKGSCWDDPTSSFEAAVKISDGPEARSTGSSGTWIDAEPSAILYETPLLLTPGVLWVDLGLRGVKVQPTSFRLEVKTKQGKTVAQSTFEAPDSLVPTETRPYRIFLRAKLANTDDIRGPLTLQISGAQKEPAEFPKETSIADLGILRDGLTWLSALATVLALLWFLRPRTNGDYPEQSLRSKLDLATNLLGAGTVVLLPLLLYARAWILQNTSIGFANMIYVLAPALVGTALTYFVIQKHYTDKFDLIVARGEFETVEELLRWSYRPRLVLMACGVALMVAVVVGYLGVRSMSAGDDIEILRKVEP